MTSLDATKERVIPVITAEEDLPFSENPKVQTVSQKGKWLPIDLKLSKTDDLTKFRFETGRKVLYIAMFAMAAMVFLDLWAIRNFESTSGLIESAFEAFKLITMTVLGYIFGSNSTKE